MPQHTVCQLAVSLPLVPIFGPPPFAACTVQSVPAAPLPHLWLALRRQRRAQQVKRIRCNRRRCARDRAAAERHEAAPVAVARAPAEAGGSVFDLLQRDELDCGVGHRQQQAGHGAAPEALG